jgi:RHH-type rel operon transcriptional repressor/antitoxin RelB
MLAIRLPNDIEQKLNDLAKKTGRTKTFYAREAIIEYLQDLEDIYTAQKRLSKKGERLSLKEMKQHLELDN